MNPLDPREQTRQVMANAAATSVIIAYLHDQNLHFLAVSDFEEICRTLASWNNSSISLVVSLNGFPCNQELHDEVFSGHSSLRVSLPGKVVEVEAWVR